MVGVPPGHVDDEQVGIEQAKGSEDNDGLDDELRPFLFATIYYLNLSKSGLLNAPQHIPTPLLVRQEHDAMSKDNGGPAMLNGQRKPLSFFCFLSDLT